MSSEALRGDLKRSCLLSGKSHAKGGKIENAPRKSPSRNINKARSVLVDIGHHLLNLVVGLFRGINKPVGSAVDAQAGVAKSIRERPTRSNTVFLHFVPSEISNHIQAPVFNLKLVGVFVILISENFTVPRIITICLLVVCCSFIDM